jgi:hypothetical protein
MSMNWTFSFTECRANEIYLDPGFYELEVWGACGGQLYNIARGLGGYARGTIELKERTKVFVHVGSQGSDTTAEVGSQGCNGGGYAVSSCARSGGGSTDIRLKYDSLYSRVIVAGGGGGTSDQSNDAGGHGGGLNGGDGSGSGYSNGKAGKGGGQLTETTACADGTENTCSKGTFGYGGNMSGSCAGAGGGGWFGGSAAYCEYGGGGGSGYVYTKSSAKVAGYLLGEEFYLTNTSLLSGSQSFPKPDKSGNETGHLGNGYAIIKTLRYLPPPPPPAITSILDFSFTRNDNFVVNDTHSKFSFNEYGTYTSIIKPGSFLIYANGSSCGQLIHAEYRTRKQQTMKISFINSIKIYVNDEIILQAPGHGTQLDTTISPKLRVLNNYSMHEYQCLGVDHSELAILYLYSNQFLCQSMNSKFSIPFTIFSLLIFS